MILVVVQGYVLYGDMAMRQWNWQSVAMVAVSLILAGCEGSGNEPTELTEQLQREMTLISPTVGGPSQEFSVEKKPADITPAVEAALKDSGVRLVQHGQHRRGRVAAGQVPGRPQCAGAGSARLSGTLDGQSHCRGRRRPGPRSVEAPVRRYYAEDPLVTAPSAEDPASFCWTAAGSVSLGES